MAFPRRKFNQPFSLRAALAVPNSRVDIIEPTLGFNQSQPATDLQPGQTPDSENFVVEDGYLVPRSGLSVLGESNTSLGAVGLMVAEHHDVDGSRYPVVASARTVIALLSNSWSTLSYVGSDSLSGSTDDRIFGASVYEPVRDQNWFVFSNGVNLPKVWLPSESTYGDLPDYASVESIGKIPFGLDDRLCFFNCGDSSTSFPTRVRWSDRGNTSWFSTVGAGFEDLMDMRGVGMGVAPREFDALLFTTEEVWVQRPRRDAFAFDFFPLSRSVGCPYPKTIANTPQGVAFLTRELEPYIVRGSEVVPIGKPVHQFVRSQIRNANYSFGVYNSRRQRYEFYYETGAASGRPHRGLYLDMDTGSWHPINLHAFEMGAGSEVGSDQGTIVTWDGLTDTWEDYPVQWNSFVGSTSKDKEVMLVSSAGTVYRLREDQFTDDGSVITSQWESHAMSGEDPTRKVSLDKVWTEYKATEAGNFTLEFRGDDGRNFGQASVVTYIPSDATKSHTPVFLTGDHPQFRITVNDGKRPRIARFIPTIRDAGQF